MVEISGLEPPTSPLSAECSNQLSYISKWWFWTELNRRHIELQSIALPTELQNHYWRPQRDSNSWSPPWQGGAITNFAMGPLVAGAGLEPTTFGLWARRATNCSIPRYIKNGGRWGIRTPARVSPTLGFQDRPLQPGLGNLPYNFYSPHSEAYLASNLVDIIGLEPMTARLWAGSSNQLS